jgi:hypothetical protein
MSGDFRRGPPYPSFLFIDLATVSIGQLLGPFLELDKLANELILFEIELLELG